MRRSWYIAKRQAARAGTDSVAVSPIISGGDLVASSPNWARIGLAPKVLTVAAPTATYLDGDLSILEQTGTDFSVAGHTILSAGGGKFQCGIFLANPAGTLDAGSTRQRWLIFAARVTSEGTIANLGIDSTVPIIEGAGPIFAIADTKSSAVGFVSPGGVCLSDVIAQLANGFGTDSIDLEFFVYEMFVWAI